MNPEDTGCKWGRATGFTLVEMLAAMAVFTLLLVLVGQLVGGATRAIASSKKMMDADSQARFIFSRLGADLAGMIRRPDVDVIFRRDDSSVNNDQMFFYSEVPASSGAGITAANKNTVSLVGYRINTDPANPKSLQMQRLGLGLAFGNAGGSTTVNEMVFLTYTSAANFQPEDYSTIDKRWNNVVFAPPDSNPASNFSLCYSLLGEQVFRLEYCFLLKDGTYSRYPVRNKIDGSSPATASAPTSSDGAVGDGWFDATTGRAYICEWKSGNERKWRAAGFRDVTAVIVAIAILDQTSRQIVSTDLAVLASKLRNVTDADLAGPGGRLMEESWKEILTSPTFAQTSGLPPLAASQIRIYQRFFYLNTP